mmetsp:Transcript_49027/g.130071  ORF Transcript_49027/g.130071 Transcript_49027/m.130071 type:complete len:293 (-) Transcript_49027:72-950(-)
MLPFPRPLEVELQYIACPLPLTAPGVELADDSLDKHLRVRMPLNVVDADDLVAHVYRLVRIGPVPRLYHARLLHPEHRRGHKVRVPVKNDSHLGPSLVRFGHVQLHDEFCLVLLGVRLQALFGRQGDRHPRPGLVPVLLARLFWLRRQSLVLLALRALLLLAVLLRARRVWDPLHWAPTLRGPVPVEGLAARRERGGPRREIVDLDHGLPPSNPGRPRRDGGDAFEVGLRLRQLIQIENSVAVHAVAARELGGVADRPPCLLPHLNGVGSHSKLPQQRRGKHSGASHASAMQ